MASFESFESLSDAELRKKLLDFGYDVPVALNRDFLIKKLEKVASNKPTERAKPTRKSTPPVLPSRPPATTTTTNNTSRTSRLSLNETGLRQRQGSKEPEFSSLSSVSNASRGRKSMGSVGIGNASAAKSTVSTDTRSSTSSTTSITTNSRRSLQRQNVYNIDQNQMSGRLNRVVEEQNHAQDDEEEDEDVEEEEEDEDDDDDDDMEIDDEDEGVGLDMQKFSKGVSSAGRTTATSSSSFNFGSPLSSLTSSYLTRRTRASETTASPPVSKGVSRGESSVSPNSRFQSYLSFFKGDTRSEPQMPRGHVSPTSTPGSYFFSSTPGTPYSTTATAGSPSYRSFGEISGDESEDEEEGEIRDSRKNRIWSKFNPVNWIPQNVKGWFSSSNAENLSPTERQTDNYGYARATTSSNYSSASSTPFSSYAGRYSTSSTTTGLNGHWGGPASASLANRLYSPATPPPSVPPAMAAGRQAGFKAFFSRGERNGYGYGGNNAAASGSTDWASSSHLISKILVVIFILGFLVLGGVYYYKSTLIALENGKSLTTSGESGISEAVEKPKLPPPPPPTRKMPTSLNYPVCGLDGVDMEACVSKEHVRNSVTLFTALKEELIQRVKWKGCGSDVEEIINLQSAKNLLYRLVDLKKPEVDSAFNGMLLLVTENPSCGMKIEPNGIPSDEDISSREVLNLDNSIATITAVGVSPNFMCLVRAGFYNLFMYFVFFIMLSCIGYVGYKGMQYWRGRKVREEHEMFDMIEKILDLLYQHFEQSKSEGGDAFLAVNHIRDELLSPRDRKKKEALWNKVVYHISTNESRVREEIQHISGEEFRVWRWLPSASPLVSKFSNPTSQGRKSSRHSLPPQMSGGGGTTSGSPSGLYPNLGSMTMDLDSSEGGTSPNSLNNKWQGQAFEMFDGSPNALPIIPTTCLKIRQMFDTERGSDETGGNRIERAILEKCPNSKILHIGIEYGSNDGCVYVRCHSKEDARAAYSSLHGWWFDGHLLSVKFLREERYFTRFPEAKYRTIPMTQAFLSSPPVQPLASQQNYSNTMNIRSGSTSTGGGGGPGPGASTPRVRYTTGY